MTSLLITLVACIIPAVCTIVLLVSVLHGSAFPIFGKKRITYKEMRTADKPTADGYYPQAFKIVMGKAFIYVDEATFNSYQVGDTFDMREYQKMHKQNENSYKDN